MMPLPGQPVTFSPAPDRPPCHGYFVREGAKEHKLSINFGLTGHKY